MSWWRNRIWIVVRVDDMELPVVLRATGSACLRSR
jgi:hypothetical protein